ncbi:hypothetical protein BCR32DRAFT_143560 [Anaeromyces robustus]|uniref:Uncharacterized protein n=1 Tax=Anaeromyces robustus TaxID=1754192 RepID=A0A1Y1XDE1_9FUNG|nr:hypothetical protein BCR32DRAFT_143560 [Anaeromyces robustus]|eukprot:ORX83737.1 hypothetical protein BCR32DRAFT_143560 [Anaeromyces robustus]
MLFKIGFLVLSLVQFIGWEIIFFNGIYEDEKNHVSSGVLNNLIVFFIYVSCHGLSWFMLLFGDTFSTELNECKCIKYLFKTSKYCLQDLGYYSRSVLSNCAIFIVNAMCLSTINLTFGGVNLYLSIKREHDRQIKPEIPEMPGFIVSAITFSSIFCVISLISFVTLLTLVMDIIYQSILF